MGLFWLFYLSVTWFILRGETKIDFKPVVREGRESEGERLVQQCWELNPALSGTLRRSLFWPQASQVGQSFSSFLFFKTFYSFCHGLRKSDMWRFCERPLHLIKKVEKINR